MSRYHCLVAGAALAALCHSAGHADDKKPTPAEYVAKVVEKSGKTKSFQMLLKGGEDGKSAEEVTYLYRRDLGVRMEQRDPKTGDAVRIGVGNVKDEKTILLDVKTKTATVRRFTERQMEGEGVLPRSVRTTTDVSSGADEKIGGRTVRVLEGVAKGLRGGVWTMWVDPKTDLPVRLRMDKPGPDGKVVAIQMEFIEWDQEYEARLFSTEVPKEYKLASTDKE